MEKDNNYSELEYFRKEVCCLTIEEVIRGSDITIKEYLQCVTGYRELTLEEVLQISDNLNVPLDILFPKVF